jgi:hypothetical protein
MGPRLLIRNPSFNWQKGHLAVKWQDIPANDILPQKVVAYNASGDKLFTQYDRVDPHDPARAVLLFITDNYIKPDSESQWPDSAVVTLGEGEQEAQDWPRLEVHEVKGQERAVKLINNRLELYFSLVAAPGDDERNWYAGSATSVRLDGEEILDAFRAQFNWMDHDPEKRCMQIDQVRLSHPAWEEDQESSIIDQNYSLISQSRGPVRASITVASPSFKYSYRDIFTGKHNSLEWKLFRVISLYKDADYIIEELYVKAVPEKEIPGLDTLDLYFTARYFNYMDMGLDARLFRYPHIPDWFAFACRHSPFQGYGFATDVHTSYVNLPHPAFPDPENEHKSFSFELGSSKKATCLHLFKRSRPRELESETGKSWDRYIYQPLKAEILS